MKQVTDGYGKTVTYQYDGVGNVTTFTLPAGGSAKYTYTYNELNRVASVTNNLYGVTVNYTYDTAGRVTDVTRPGSKIHYQYNARNWITDVQNLKTDSTVIYTAHYDYNDGSLWDQTGNPLKKTENIGGTTYVTTYRYDRLYRLIEETKCDSSNNIVNTETYTYDAVGNRLTRTKDGTTYASTYGYNNKLSTLTGGGQSASFTYDGDGNITGVTGSLLGAWTMTYNDSDELVNAVRPRGTDTYLYNALGQRSAPASPAACSAMSTSATG